jgi:hypothetical protein
MKNPRPFFGGIMAGALLMFFMDARSGRRRRALVRDKTLAAGHDVVDAVGAKAKRVADRAKGVLATGRLHRVTSRPPENDPQLHERIRARLGHVVSHPRAIDVEVEQGHVRLTGHILRHELDGLLGEVRSMAGVKEVHRELQLHESPGRVPQLQGHTQPAERVQRQPENALH